jgi:two-component system sensor histidine kinase RegB
MEAAAAPVLIVADRTLRQALLNILNNAADACQQRVAVKSRWDSNELQLEIIDDGPGVLEGLREKLGREVVSSKGEQGLGLGLYLAHSVLRRLGGSVVFGPPGTVGTVVEIRLPLSSLLA